MDTHPCGATRYSGTAELAEPRGPLDYFKNMISNCIGYAAVEKAKGRPIVGIMCEFTPRELILAAGAVPVVLCGGSAKPIAHAEKELPSNLCPLIKSTYGYHLDGNNPFIEMANLIVAETTCDGKKKMFELMSRRRPMYVLELPQKSDTAEGLEVWTGQLRLLQAELEHRFGVLIDRESLRDAINRMNKERALRRELAALMKRDCPPLTGRELLEFKSSIASMPEDLIQYEGALSELTRAQGPDERTRRVRVLLTGVPVPHGAERVVDIIENCGGLIVAIENCTGLKPLLEDVDENAVDPIHALAEKYYHLSCSVMTPNHRRIDMLRALAAQYRVDCIIELVWQACLTYDVESVHVRQLAEFELHIPYMKIVTDYSPSDSARIEVRVEALFETVHARKQRGFVQ